VTDRFLSEIDYKDPLSGKSVKIEPEILGATIKSSNSNNSNNSNNSTSTHTQRKKMLIQKAGEIKKNEVQDILLVAKEYNIVTYYVTQFLQCSDQLLEFTQNQESKISKLKSESVIVQKSQPIYELPRKSESLIPTTPLKTKPSLTDERIKLMISFKGPFIMLTDQHNPAKYSYTTLKSFPTLSQLESRQLQHDKISVSSYCGYCDCSFSGPDIKHCNLDSHKRNLTSNKIKEIWDSSSCLCRLQAGRKIMG